VLHDSGPRARGPFIDVNCAAIPETMLEAELFGFEASAFTDAKRAKAGLFEAASAGTLFLDEIDTFPMVLQGKLLKIIEEMRLRRLGAVADYAVDVKLIAATSADLNARVADGRFRLDLYHRLAVVLLEFPPLRARGDDILMLARQFLQQYATGHQAPPKRLHPSAEAWLLLLFAFGLPQTMEQLPQRAVHAALALQELAGDESPLAEEGTRPVLRLGLHWGPVLMAIQARDTSLRVLAVGDTLAMPVRLSGQAAPGEMLTSATMGRVVESWCALQPWAGIVGPGRDEHFGISAIVSAQSGVERLAAQTSCRGLRFVGRTREMAMLIELWAHAQDGSGQVVGIAGEPGVGKSRLLAEFIRACQPTSVRPLETWSTAYTQTMPYWPFIDLLRGYFSIEERDDGPMIREKAVQQLVYLDLLRSLILSLLLSCWRGPSMIRPAGHRSPATPPAYPRRHSARADTRE
jgi:hypothetical protein